MTLQNCIVRTVSMCTFLKYIDVKRGGGGGKGGKMLMSQ